MRRVFAVCFYVLAGFFVYETCVSAFIDHAVKWWIVGVFTLPALVCSAYRPHRTDDRAYAIYREMGGALSY
jgi:hypothetical protein